MGVSLSLECSYAVSRAYCFARLLFRARIVGRSVGRVSGRLKAPHIALPGYRNDSQ